MFIFHDCGLFYKPFIVFCSKIGQKHGVVGIIFKFNLQSIHAFTQITWF